MIQRENPKYTKVELEEFRAELEKKIKEPVHLEIEKYRYQHHYYQTHRHVYNTICCKKINTEIKYSSELYKKYNKKRIEEIKEGCKKGNKREEEKEVEEKIREDIMLFIKESKYHVITSRNTRKYNVLEDYEFAEKYLEKILGKEIVEEMKKKLVRSNEVKFFFENKI